MLPIIRRQVIINNQSREFIPTSLTSDLTNSVGRNGEREGIDFLTRRERDRDTERGERERQTEIEN